MLIGREAMSNRVLIDPDSSLCLGTVSDEDVKGHYNAATLKKDGLRILVLASNPELYSNKRLIEAGEERGHEIRFVNISQCYMNISSKNPEVHYRGGQLLDGIDAVIPRIKPSMTFYGCALARQFQSTGAYCLNDAVSISRSRDKLRSLQLLSDQRVPMPTTGFCRFTNGHVGYYKNGRRSAISYKAFGGDTRERRSLG